VIKRPNLRIHEVEEGTEVQTKGMEDLFNGITERDGHPSAEGI
jgi:hypothetical protein